MKNTARLSATGRRQIKKSMTSHQLAKHLLSLADLPVSCHEHGELLKSAAVETVAANVGLLECIALRFE